MRKMSIALCIALFLGTLSCAKGGLNSTSSIERFSQDIAPYYEEDLVGTDYAVFLANLQEGKITTEQFMALLPVLVEANTNDLQAGEITRRDWRIRANTLEDLADLMATRGDIPASYSRESGFSIELESELR